MTESRYSWLDLSNLIVYDEVTKKEIMCYEYRRFIDDNEKEYEPKFLVDELCNKEFVLWALRFTRFSKKANFKNDHNSLKFSKYIYIRPSILDKDIIYKLINCNYEYISKIPNEFLSDEIIDYAINKNVRSLARIPKHRRTYERCFYAVSKAGSALLYVPDEIKNIDICKKAVLRYPKSIKFVPSRIITKDFINEIISSGVKIDKEDYDYVNNCIEMHDKVSNELSRNTDVTINNLINISLVELSDYFSINTLKKLRDLKIYTLGQFFEKILDKDFILLLGNNKSVINEIYAANRLLKCKYFDCNPNIDITDENISFEDVCILMGFSTSIYNHLMRKFNITSSKSFFELLQSDDAYIQLRRTKNIGDTTVKRILTRSYVIIKYYNTHNTNKQKVLK